MLKSLSPGANFTSNQIPLIKPFLSNKELNMFYTIQNKNTDIEYISKFTDIKPNLSEISTKSPIQETVCVNCNSDTSNQNMNLFHCWTCSTTFCFSCLLTHKSLKPSHFSEKIEWLTDKNITNFQSTIRKSKSEYFSTITSMKDYITDWLNLQIKTINEIYNTNVKISSEIMELLDIYFEVYEKNKLVKNYNWNSNITDMLVAFEHQTSLNPILNQFNTKNTLECNINKYVDLLETKYVIPVHLIGNKNFEIKKKKLINNNIDSITVLPDKTILIPCGKIINFYDQEINSTGKFIKSQSKFSSFYYHVHLLSDHKTWLCFMDLHFEVWDISKEITSLISTFDWWEHKVKNVIELPCGNLVVDSKKYLVYLKKHVENDIISYEKEMNVLVHQDGVLTVQWWINNSILTGGMETCLKIWDVNFTLVSSVITKHAVSNSWIVPNNGIVIGFCNGEMSLFNTDGFKKEGDLLGHLAKVFEIYLINQFKILSVGLDNKAMIWDWYSWQCLQVFWFGDQKLWITGNVLNEREVIWSDNNMGLYIYSNKSNEKC